MIYAENLEATALAQFEDAMSQDFVVKGALMPDAHTGYSLPIGAVVATKDVVVPAWVGYDIGCGMCAVQLHGVTPQDIRDNSKGIFDLIYERVPVGFNKNIDEVAYSTLGLTPKGADIAVSKKYRQALGSLGSGNHFIEIGFDELDQVWIVVHSGSRGVGHGIATHYMTLASSDTTKLEEEFDKNNAHVLKYNPEKYPTLKRSWVMKNMSSKPKEGHFALDVESKEGKDYIQDLNWCLDYALANRKEMINRVASCIAHFTGAISSAKPINRNHNHAVLKDGLWVHRKGATHAEEGMLGVIPGNMHDGSFIVMGKGNPDSLCSSSHGAGRVLGRKKAKEKLNLEDFKERMQGITALVDDSTLDESPLAYKDIFEVMRLQKDLVEVIAYIKPIINIKG